MHSTYDSLITDVRKQIRFKGYSNYYELHHVVPLNDGGKDVETNLILLTILEHCEAHFLYAMEHKLNDEHAYQANLNSAWIVLYGKRKKPPINKEETLYDFLMNPDMSVVHRIEENRKKKSEAFKAKFFKRRDTLHTWITNGKSNKKIENTELSKYFELGWRKGYTAKKKR